MTRMKQALTASGAVDISEILKKDFFNYIRMDSTLRSIFEGKSPDTDKKAYSYGVKFNTWMYQYNHGGKTANMGVIPEHKIPSDLIDCAEMFGYMGKKEFLPAWEYIKYLLQEEGIREFAPKVESEPSIRELTLFTLALVQGVLQMDQSTDKKDVLKLQLKQLIDAMSIDKRGFSKNKDKIQAMIQRAADEARKGNEEVWNARRIMEIAQTIVKTIN